MTVVYGQIESLKRIRDILNQNGIDRFSSVGDIKDFVDNYEAEKIKIFKQIEQDVDFEIDKLQIEGFKLQKNYDNLCSKVEIKLHNKIKKLQSRCDQIQSRNTDNPLKNLIDSLYAIILKLIRTSLEKNFNGIIKLYTFRTEKNLNKKFDEINVYAASRNQTIEKRYLPRISELEFTRKVIAEINPLIAGAIGENMVVNELKKLPDKYILINNFSIDFEPPIYYKKEKDRIFSIQIDHLLVTNAGVFILETKNWSKESIKRFDLRSPVKQVERTSYALFLMLNAKKRQVELNTHHWGQKKIPVKSLVVMINHKPKEKFRFVEIKKLNELNKYITYFEPVLDDSEVFRISEYLKALNN